MTNHEVNFELLIFLPSTVLFVIGIVVKCISMCIRLSHRVVNCESREEVLIKKAKLELEFLCMFRLHAS